MSDGAVTERRLRPIQDAVASGNWKQALKECEKWQKKGEKSDKFLALKAYVLVNQPDTVQIEKGEAETLQLCSRSPAVTDFDTIHILQDALRDLSLDGQEGNKLWERAAAAKPGDKAILMTWLNRGIEDSQWQTAQKAAMALRKAFPSDRNYDFWNILLCFLVHQDDRVTEKERTLFGTLAYRLMSKAAEAAPTDQNGISNPGKGIVTPEEVALLVEIYLRTGHGSDAAQLLTGSTMSRDSNIGQQDPQLITSLLLQYLDTAADAKTRIGFARELLKDTTYHSDDRLWAALKDIYLHGDERIKEEAAKLLEEHLPNDDIRHRSFLTRHHQSQSELSQANLKFCKSAITRGGTRPTIFRQIRDNLEILDEQNLQDLTAAIDNSTSDSRIFLLKIARLRNATSSSDLFAQASEALDVYNNSLVTGTPAPECAILAAQSLIQLAFSSKSTRTHLLRAASILALSLPSNEDYFPILVLLVHLYRYLGLFSLAFAVFTTLSVKNLQWETVGHLVLTRVGTLHPHRPHDENLSKTGKPEPAFDPNGGIDMTLEVSERLAKGLNDSVQKGLRAGSYSNVINAVNSRKNIERSTWRRICALEEQKLARMTGDGSIEAWQALEGDEALVAGDLVDQRDTSFVPTYSATDLRLWEHLQCGPTPRTGWLAVMTLQERLLNCFRRGKESKLSDAGFGQLDRAWDALMEAQRRVTGSLPDQTSIEKELTEAEQLGYAILQQILGVIKKIRGGEKADGESITAVSTSLSALFDASSSPDSNPPASAAIGVDWHTVHGWYVALETCNLVHEFSQFADPTTGPVQTAKGGKKGKGATGDGGASTGGASLPQAQRKVLAEKAAEVHEGVKRQASEVKGRFGEGGVLGRVLESVMPAAASDGAMGEGGEKAFAEQFEKFVDGAGGEAALETLVGRWLASWEDACEGVLGVPELGLGKGKKGGKGR